MSKKHVYKNVKAIDDYASPMIAGICCLINDYFISKCEMPLTAEQMKKFLLDNTVDRRFKMPKFKDIDISKYQ